MKSAAYRSGAIIYDERAVKECDYTRKRGVIHTEIVAPDHAPSWVFDRSKLWNSVEHFEKHPGAQVCREVEMALPNSLSEEQQQAVARKFVETEFKAKGLVADMAFHVADTRERKAKPENPNSHIMMTLRKPKNNHVHILYTFRPMQEDGRWAKTKEDSRMTPEELGQGTERLRESWARHCNAALKEAGIASSIDHRSNAARGIFEEATIHEGGTARRIEEEGGISPRMAKNRAIRAKNQIHRRVLEDLKVAASTIRIVITRMKRVLLGSVAVPTRSTQTPSKPLEEIWKVFQEIDAANEAAAKKAAKKVATTAAEQKTAILETNRYDEMVKQFEKLKPKVEPTAPAPTIIDKAPPPPAPDLVLPTIGPRPEPVQAAVPRRVRSWETWLQPPAEKTVQAPAKTSLQPKADHNEKTAAQQQPPPPAATPTPSLQPKADSNKPWLQPPPMRPDKLPPLDQIKLDELEQPAPPNTNRREAVPAAPPPPKVYDEAEYKKAAEFAEAQGNTSLAEIIRQWITPLPPKEAKPSAAKARQLEAEADHVPGMAPAPKRAEPKAAKDDLAAIAADAKPAEQAKPAPTIKKKDAALPNISTQAAENLKVSNEAARFKAWKDRGGW